jgi:hypothetical protein
MIKWKRQAFVIAPIRNTTDKYQNGIAAQIASLEKDYDVYWPARDTDQRPITGIPECKQNLAAMKKAHVVFVMWDGISHGVIFDLGMAFAMKKNIQPIVGYMPSVSQGKSIQNLIYSWSNEGL